MIELGIFNNGATDLPAKRLPGGLLVPDGNLAEIHESLQRVLVGQVRQGILADQLGFDSFYLTEHHFQFEGAEFSPNPMSVGMSIASRTKRIRIGQATNVLTEWEPVRFAEQAAMLDVISGGRLDCGIGRGYQGREVEVLGGKLGSSVQDQERNRRYFEEVFALIKKAWTEVSFSHNGEFFTIPPAYTKWNHLQSLAYFAEQEVERSVEDVFHFGPPEEYGSGVNPVERTTTTLKELSVFPQPVQKPHPPLFMPSFSSRTAWWAAAKGVNLYALTAPTSRTKLLMEKYHAESEKYDWPDRLGDGKPWKFGWDGARRRGVAVTKYLHVLDPALGNTGGLQRVKDSLEAGWSFYGPFGFASTLSPAGVPPYDPSMHVSGDLVIDNGVAHVGSKQQVIEKILADRDEFGIDDMHLMCYFELGGYTTSETEEQMQFFAEEIAPVLRRECGGGVDFPDSTADLDVGLRDRVTVA